MSGSRPPFLPRFLLALLLRGEEREVISGDLEEEFRVLMGRSDGGSHARAWYRRQALKAVGGRLAERVRRSLGSRYASPSGAEVGDTGARSDGTGGRGGGIMRGLFRDVRFGLRTLARRPGFTAVAILALALGVGANTAVFSILDAVLLRPLGFPDAGRIVRVWGGRPLSKSTLAKIRQQVTAFEAVTGYESERLVLTGAGPAAEFDGAAVAPAYFDVVGVQPARGRAFLPEESEPGNDGVVILSHELWQGVFGGDPDIVGRTVRLGGAARTVIGVMPKGYRPLNRAWRMWVPQTADPADFSDWRGTAGTTVIARMAPGAALERANAQLAPIARAIHDADPDVFGDAFVRAATVTPLQRATVGSFRTTLWVLLGAVALVLLIACANVANLLLANGESRSQELAIRRSLGASAGRLLGQLMTESTLLGLLGGGLGYALAWLALWAFRAQVTAAVPLGDRVGLNGTVLAFALATSLVTAGLFGLWPAVRALRPDLRESLQAGGRRTGRSGGRRGMNRTLMAFEVALSVVLLTGAGLLIKSTWLLQRVDAGFRSENLLTLRVNLPGGRYEKDEARVDYFRRLEQRVAAVPGVLRVGSMSFLPMTSSHMSTLFTVTGRPPQEGAPRSYAMVQAVMPGLGDALGTRLLRGRWLQPTDREDGPRVCVINQAMATAAFGADDPLGKQIQLFGWFDATVVGIVENVRELSLAQPARPGAYLAYPQLPGFSAMYVVIRTAGAPRNLIPSVVAAVSALDRDVPITQVATMDDVLRASTADSRLTTTILALFAAIAFVLSVVGVYGVISYTVSARTYEIGVRMAMGAGRTTVVREMVIRALVPLGLGVLVGTGAALALGRVIASQLYEVRPRDPVVLVAVVASLLLAAVAASVIPARRAATVDPVVCLNA